jgi:hypothetical protein
VAGDGDQSPSTLAGLVSLGLDRAILEPDYSISDRLRGNGIDITRDGTARIEGIVDAARSVKASYVATLRGGLHVHMLSARPLEVQRQFEDHDIEFRVAYDPAERGHWFLHHPEWPNQTRLEFSLPTVLLQTWERSDFDRRRGLQLKQQHFERIELVGPVRHGSNPPIIRHVVAAIDRGSMDAAIARAARREPSKIDSSDEG